MSNSNNNIVITNLEDSIFDGWVQIENSENHINSEFVDYTLITDPEDEWVDIDVDEIVAVTQEHDYLKKYAYGEFLAHNFAYTSPANGKHKILQEDGTYQEYECTQLLSDNAGLVGYILTPMQVSADKIPDIKVVFRGTACFSSILRDLEVGGAGSASFVSNKHSILEQINLAIKNFNARHLRTQQDVNITLAGHSLGGADAQNCLIAIMDSISQKYGLNRTRDKRIPSKCMDNMDTIRDLRLFNYNSAGITKQAATQSRVLAEFLAEKRQAGETKLNIETYNLLVVGDGVQQTGEAHVLSDVAADVAKVDVLKANIGYGHRNKLDVKKSLATVGLKLATGSTMAATMATTGLVGSVVLGAWDTMKAHTACLFQEQGTKINYERFNNQDPVNQEVVAKVLNKKSYALNYVHGTANVLFSNAASAVTAVGSNISCGGSMSKNVLQGAASSLFSNIGNAFAAVGNKIFGNRWF